MRRVTLPSFPSDEIRRGRKRFDQCLQAVARSFNATLRIVLDILGPATTRGLLASQYHIYVYSYKIKIAAIILLNIEYCDAFLYNNTTMHFIITVFLSE